MTQGVREFTISTRQTGRKRTVKVKIYDDLTKMRADADRYTNSDRGHFGDALGVTHTYESIYIDGDAETPSPGAAIVRLHHEHLGTSVVVHEMVHVASGIYRQDWEPEHGPVHESMPNEEVFSYLAGNLTRRAVDRLYKLGYYAPAPTA